jgi:hypothetical protein
MFVQKNKESNASLKDYFLKYPGIVLMKLLLSGILLVLLYSPILCLQIPEIQVPVLSALLWPWGGRKSSLRPRCK